ncbi:MAG: hypothetical protein J6R12_03235 [Bacteroidales bacterium]|nr:hypothetical protein [Bacteroidales bacterium]
MYYLPIYVNNRRMHVVKLSPKIESTLFSFLVNSSNHYDVFSLPSASIQLICDDNNSENVDLKNAHYVLERVDSANAPQYRHSDNIPVFNVRICSGKGQNDIKDDAKDYFRFCGNLGDTITPGEEPFTLKALSRGEQQLKEYIMQFTYETVDEFGLASTHVGAIRICEYADTDVLLKASLDFGSEASQIHLSTSRPEVNMNIRDAFVDIVGEDKDKDYWQGRREDDQTLYKSIYHIHKEPAATNFGDMPMVNGDRNFLQSLLPVTSSTEDHILLPNLKLVEQLTGLISLDNITFNENGFMGNVDEGPITANLSSLELTNGILRQILCNFLAVILKSEPNKEYLHFILLVPNVYLQNKVKKLVTGLYDDFNLLREKPLFSRYKGIEVSIVSESDASFFGVRARAGKADLPFIKDANYLIIDAGKGTTDFSFISQRGENLANYSSMYRSGIPASGHVLTYAFYDALRSYFHNIGRGDFFDDIMRESETSEILNFVSLLEQFKIRSKDLVEDKTIDSKAMALKTNYMNTLYHLNEFLSNLLKRGKMIPGMTAALNEKIGLMTSLLKDSIVGYTKNKLKDVTCNKVFLTGRAFMLHQFREAVSTMLVDNGVVLSKTDIFYRDDLTKSICTYGAIKVGEQSVVNKNSNMLGCPHLFEETGEVLGDNKNKGKKNLVKEIKQWLRKVRHVDDGIGADMSFDFFYEGIELRNVSNAVFSLSGIDTLVGTGKKDDLQVYYTGDGYIWKHAGECKRIDIVGTISKLDNNVCSRLVRESVFPFDIASFGLSYIPANPNSSDSGDTTYTPNDEPVVIDVPTPHDPNGNINALDR